MFAEPQLGKVGFWPIATFRAPQNLVAIGGVGFKNFKRPLTHASDQSLANAKCVRHLALRLAKGWPGGEHETRDVGLADILRDVPEHKMRE